MRLVPRSVLMASFSFVLLFTGLTCEANPSTSSVSSQEQLGREALSELGFRPENFDARSLREAALLREYQKAWNDYDPGESDFTRVDNPRRIVEHYTNGAGLLYRDMCLPQGARTKSNLFAYLRVLYAKFPRQVWGDGWRGIHLYQGAHPGEWAYSYDFAMYRSVTPDAKPALTGTGMERVQFDESGRLISDEVHLILPSGVVTCKFGG